MRIAAVDCLEEIPGLILELLEVGRGDGEGHVNLLLRRAWCPHVSGEKKVSIATTISPVGSALSADGMRLDLAGVSISSYP
jgi:hypothetical protein